MGLRVDAADQRSAAPDALRTFHAAVVDHFVISDLLRPLHFLLAWFATIRTRREAQILAYLRAENRVLRRNLGSKVSGR